MADDEKTLKIDVNFRETSQSSPAAPSSPSGPPSPPAPPDPPSPSAPSQGGASSPPVPIVPSGGSGSASTPPSPPAPPGGGSPPVPPTPPIPPTPGGAGVAPIATEAAATGGVLATLTAAVPPLLIVVGAATAAFGGLVVATGLITAAFNRVIEDLQEYSAEIASAQAEAEISDIESRIRSADRLGNEMSDFIETRQETVNLLREIKTDLIETFYPTLKGMLEALNLILRLVQIITTIMEWLQEKWLELWIKLTALLEWATQYIPIIGPMVSKLNDWLEEALRKMRSDDDANDVQKDILAALDPGRSDILEDIDTDEKGLPRKRRRLGDI